jgi:hypothetical protein
LKKGKRSAWVMEGFEVERWRRLMAGDDTMERWTVSGELGPFAE